MTITQTILSVFGLTLVMFLVTAGVFLINRRLAGGDKKTITRWLESKGHKIHSIEWILYPTRRRFIFQRCHTFETKFSDPAGHDHHAFIAVPAWSSPVLLEDNTIK